MNAEVEVATARLVVGAVSLKAVIAKVVYLPITWFAVATSLLVRTLNFLGSSVIANGPNAAYTKFEGGLVSVA